MPQSVRDQIEEAIRNAADKGERVMLMIMLNLADTMLDVRDTALDTARVVGEIHKGFAGIAPQTHVDDHGFVGEQRQRRATDKVLVEEAKKGAAHKLGGVMVEVVKVVLVAAITAVSVKYFG